MKTVTIHEAKTHLSRLINEVLAGEEVIIARREHPLVRLTVLDQAPTRRRVGSLPDLVTRMDEDFNHTMEDWDEAIDPTPEATSRS